MKYVCDVCGWEYDEEAGCPEQGIAPGTKWEDVPEDFVCPLCGVGKDQFSSAEGPPQNSLPENRRGKIRIFRSGFLFSYKRPAFAAARFTDRASRRAALNETRRQVL